MKKITAFVLTLAITAAMSVTAYAESVFVPSITEKKAPEIVAKEEIEKTDEKTGEKKVLVVIADVFKKSNNEVLEKATTEDLAVTSFAEKDESNVITEEKKAVLEEVYDKLKNSKLSELSDALNEYIEKTWNITVGDEDETEGNKGNQGNNGNNGNQGNNGNKGNNGDKKTADNLVVKDLFEVTILNEDIERMLADDENKMTLTFDAQLEPNEYVIVMAFKNDEWVICEDITNNGDGTVSATFNHFCPVAILVEQKTADVPQEEIPVVTPDAPSGTAFPIWIIIAVICAVVIIFVATRKKQEK